jgi:hypothetical protein
MTRPTNYWDLPPSVQEIAGVIGVEKALELIGKLPRCIPKSGTGQGVRVMLYVPRTLRADHPLVHMIGWHAASALVEAFGGEVMKPGSCRDLYRTFRDRSIVELAADGMPLDHIAEVMGVGLRTVRNLVWKTPRLTDGKVPGGKGGPGSTEWPHSSVNQESISSHAHRKQAVAYRD